VRREYVVFALVNAVTLVMSLGVVAFVRYGLGHDGSLELQVANVATIALGTVIRFLSYRRWVFPAAVPNTPRPADVTAVG
jgi:putative flippase GtrA